MYILTGIRIHVLSVRASEDSSCLRPRGHCDQQEKVYIYFCGSTAQFWALVALMKLSVSFQLQDLGQSAGLIGRMISSSQGLC
jgi:hypothetical protein